MLRDVLREKRKRVRYTEVIYCIPLKDKEKILLCRSYLCDEFSWGYFFLRNNPRIFDFFDDFYFKTVKGI